MPLLTKMSLLQLGMFYTPFFLENQVLNRNKPGTAQVGAISKAQKQRKDFQVFSSTVPEKPRGDTRGDTLKFFIHSVANHRRKLKEGQFW